jgi:hypothetical protein
MKREDMKSCKISKEPLLGAFALLASFAVIAAVYFLTYPYGNVQLLPGTSVAAFIRDNLNVAPAVGDIVYVSSSDDPNKGVKMEYTSAGWIKTANTSGQSAAAVAMAD